MMKTPEKSMSKLQREEEEDRFDTDLIMKSVSPMKHKSPDRGLRNAKRAQLDEEESKDRSQINAFDDLIEDDYEGFDVPQ